MILNNLRKVYRTKQASTPLVQWVVFGGRSFDLCTVLVVPVSLSSTSCKVRP